MSLGPPGSKFGSGSMAPAIRITPRPRCRSPSPACCPNSPDVHSASAAFPQPASQAARSTKYWVSLASGGARQADLPHQGIVGVGGAQVAAPRDVELVPGYGTTPAGLAGVDRALG